MSFKHLLNEHYATKGKVKKYDVGGKVVHDKGETNDAKRGGYFEGRPHSEGGIKAKVKETNQPIEVEGGEVVITKRAVEDDTKREFEGKMMTNREILSEINESGGGVSFEEGGEIDNADEDDLFKDVEIDEEVEMDEFDDSHDLSDWEPQYEDGGEIPSWNLVGQELLEELKKDGVIETFEDFLPDARDLEFIKLELDFLNVAYGDIPPTEIVEKMDLAMAISKLQKELRVKRVWGGGFSGRIERDSTKISRFPLRSFYENNYERLSLVHRLSYHSSTFNDWFGDFYAFVQYIKNLIGEPNNPIDKFGLKGALDYLNFPISKVGIFMDKDRLDDLFSSKLSTLKSFKISGNDFVYMPLVVFQGTGVRFEKFKFNQFPVNYFARSYSYANWFANQKGRQTQLSDGQNSGMVLPCVLNIRRPLNMTDFKWEKISPQQFFDAIYLQTGLTPEELKVRPQFLSDKTPDLEVWVYFRNNPEMLEVLRDSGIVDGIHMYENNPSVEFTNEAYWTEVFMTFYPDQAKVLGESLKEQLEVGPENIQLENYESFLMKKGGAL